MTTIRLAGISIFLMTLLSVAAAVNPAVSPLLTAIFAWIAAFFLIMRLPRAMVMQISLMLVTGIACIVWSLDDLEQVPVIKMLSANHQLLAVIAAVSFLRLITQPDISNDESLPIGKLAVLKTLWGLHLFSSVINLSAMMIFGNRIEKDASINRIHGIIFSRTFACGCFWSPFYVAIATALLYAPGSDLVVLAIAGIPVALFGLSLTSWQLMKDEEVENTAGFPVHKEALAIPVTLSLLMIVTHLALPDFPVLTLITILSLLLTLLILLYKKRKTAMSLFGNHIHTELPNINRELSLFLAAGVMSTGLTALIASSDISLGLSEFTPLTGFLFMLVSICVSIIGVHPIITISVVGSLLSVTSFNPNLLGICMIMMWGLGIVISPLSGVNLAIQGRFGISSFSIMRWNALYVVTLLIFCAILLHLYSRSNLIM
jgi:hypothetical protein